MCTIFALRNIRCRYPQMNLATTWAPTSLNETLIQHHFPRNHTGLPSSYLRVYIPQRSRAAYGKMCVERFAEDLPPILRLRGALTHKASSHLHLPTMRVADVGSRHVKHLRSTHVEASTAAFHVL